jgi:Fic family protein
MGSGIQGSKKWRGRFERRSLAPRFGAGRAGRARSYHAFVPDRIADLDLSLRADTAGALSAAETEVRALNAAPRQLAALESMAAQMLRTEALASSAIEGLQLSHKRLARAAVLPAFDPKAQEILGNVRAMEQAIELGRGGGRLGVGDLQAIHAKLAEGTRLAPWAGKLRDEPGWITGTTPADARYVPPPEGYVPALLTDLTAFINDRGDLPPLLLAAIAHAQFETIHPFPDGNGRVGRCLIHLMLMRSGVAPRYVPPISLALAARREQYIGGLTTFQRGDLDAWAAFFAAATSSAAERAGWFAGEVTALQDSWRKKVRARSDAAVWPLIESLPAFPVLNARTAEALTGRSFQAAGGALAALEQADVLVRRDNRRRGRSWEAPELLHLMTLFEQEPAPAG